MKRFLPLILLLSVFSISKTFAQGTVNAGLRVNPVIHFALTPESDKNVGVGGGVVYGLVVDWNFSNRFALNTGLNGSLRNFKIKNDDAYTISNGNELLANTTTNYKIQYLELPINLKMKTNDFNNYNIYALIGFTNRFKLGAKGKINPESESEQSYSSSFKEDIRIYDVPFNIGAGVHWFIKDNLRAVFGMQYNHGLIDITKSDDSRVTLSGVTFNLGVLF